MAQPDSQETSTTEPTEDTYADCELEAGEIITSLEEANTVAIRQEMALRVDGPAPAPTRYYFYESDGRTTKWRLRKCGRSTISTLSVDTARKKVSKAIDSGRMRISATDKQKAADSKR